MGGTFGFWIIVLIVGAAFWALLRGRRSYYLIMASWATVGPMHKLMGYGPRHIPAKDLLAGVRSHAQRLAQQAKFFGLEDCLPAFEQYVASWEKKDGTIPQGHSLEAVISEIKKRSREAKAENRHRFSERLDAWRADVSVWAQVVSIFVPKLTRAVASEKKTIAA